MEKLSDDPLLHIFSFHDEKISPLRLVCKIWCSLLPYKIIKILINAQKKDKYNRKISIDYFINNDTIDIGFFETINFSITATFLELYDIINNISTGNLAPSVTNKNIIVSKDKNLITQCSSIKKTIRSDYKYKIKITDSSNTISTYELTIPFITNKSIVYNFGNFSIECRDILINEFKEISITKMIKSTFDTNLDEYYYKVSRDIPFKFFNSIMFNPQNDNLSPYYYKEIHDKYIEIKNKTIKNNTKKRSVCPCCGE